MKDSILHLQGKNRANIFAIKSVSLSDSSIGIMAAVLPAGSWFCIQDSYQGNYGEAVWDIFKFDVTTTYKAWGYTTQLQKEQGLNELRAIPVWSLPPSRKWYITASMWWGGYIWIDPCLSGCGKLHTVYPRVIWFQEAISLNNDGAKTSVETRINILNDDTWSQCRSVKKDESSGCHRELYVGYIIVIYKTLQNTAACLPSCGTAVVKGWTGEIPLPSRKGMSVSFYSNCSILQDTIASLSFHCCWYWLSPSRPLAFIVLYTRMSIYRRDQKEIGDH